MRKLVIFRKRCVPDVGRKTSNATLESSSGYSGWLIDSWSST